MPKAKTNSRTVKAKVKKAVLSWYEGYDLTGGGPPFGHVRVFRAELDLEGKSIVRNESAGRNLKSLVESKGKAIGKPKALFGGGDFRSGFNQKFTLPASLTVDQIEKEIPNEHVL
jgi:hypothetical protein